MSEETITRPRAIKFTGARELMLIEELAVGDKTHAELAEMFECEEKTITNASSRLRDRIAAAAEKQTAQLTGIWVARKEMRLAQLQGEIERNLRLIEDMETTAREFAESANLPGLGPDPDKLTKLQGIVLKAIAQAREESGGSSSQGTHVHIIRGV